MANTDFKSINVNIICEQETGWFGLHGSKSVGHPFEPVLEGGGEVTQDEQQSLAELHRMVKMGLEVGLVGCSPSFDCL